MLLCCAWLLVALTVLAFLAVPIWSQLDPASKPLPPVPENPAAIIFNFQKIAFAAGDLRTGEGIVCESHGLRIGVWVPKPGHQTHTGLTGSVGTAAMTVKTRRNGVVIARCS
ncbi:MAG TPA: hypothetical protein VMU39_10800 [Solirubrobacteraceae bacterium]|nr:hypothetical protein [Solirubrobacteraceae bacterium]